MAIRCHRSRNRKRYSTSHSWSSASLMPALCLPDACQMLAGGAAMNYGIAMKNRSLILALFGLISAFFAVILNLATGAGPGSGQSLAAEAVIAALIAIISGVFTYRKGGGWRFLAIAMIGPSVFVASDATMRLLFFLRHGV